jgi:hypothetical protein
MQPYLKVIEHKIKDESSTNHTGEIKECASNFQNANKVILIKRAIFANLTFYT